MITTLKTITLAAVIGAMAGLASAQDALDPGTMTCADFMAMDETVQMAAMDAMATTDAMASDDAMAFEDGMAPDDAMAADDMAADDAMATDDATAGDDMSADAMTAEAMTAMMAACEGAPHMMAMDAMSAAMP